MQDLLVAEVVAEIIIFTISRGSISLLRFNILLSLSKFASNKMLFFKKSYLYSKHIILRSLVKLKIINLDNYNRLLFEELKIIKNQPGLKILEICPKDGKDTNNLLESKPSKLIS